MVTRNFFYGLGLVVAGFLAGSVSAAPPAFSDAAVTASGSAPARVVVVRDAAATKTLLAQPAALGPMVERGLLAVTGKTNLTAAWLSLISTNDVIGLKVTASPGAQSGTRPAVVEAVVISLLAAGIAPDKIVIWDRQLGDLRQAGFDDLAARHHVQLAGALQAGWDEKATYENFLLGNLIWSDLRFGRTNVTDQRFSHVSKLLTQRVTKIISIAPLLNHNLAGVQGHIYGLAMGSADNVLRFESSQEHLDAGVPELYALPELYEHVVLSITDGLLCQYYGEQRTLIHYSVALNELRFSKDAVALDVLSLEELEKQRQLAKKTPLTKTSTELYRNAALLELGVADPKKIAVEVMK